MIMVVVWASHMQVVADIIVLCMQDVGYSYQIRQ